MYSKKVTKFISKETKETMTRLRLSHEISELEFKQKTDIVTVLEMIWFCYFTSVDLTV